MGTRYDWAGSRIKRMPITLGKRTLCMSTKEPIKMDKRDFIISPNRTEIMSQFEMLDVAIPSLEKEEGDFDQRARRCWHFMAAGQEIEVEEVIVEDTQSGEGTLAVKTIQRKAIQYIPEPTRDRKLGTEFWQLPAETLARRGGDCEDLAILLASLMVGTGISPYCVRVVMGKYMRTSLPLPTNGVHSNGSGMDTHLDFHIQPPGTHTSSLPDVIDIEKEGQLHAWVVYKTEDGPWGIIDPTWNPSMFMDTGWHLADDCDEGIADKLIEGDRHHYVPHDGFNCDHSWEILPM